MPSKAVEILRARQPVNVDADALVFGTQLGSPLSHRNLLRRQLAPTAKKLGKNVSYKQRKNQSTQELVDASIQVLTDALESGHGEVLTSYLKAMARFITTASATSC